MQLKYVMQLTPSCFLNVSGSTSATVTAAATASCITAGAKVTSRPMTFQFITATLVSMCIFDCHSMSTSPIISPDIGVLTPQPPSHCIVKFSNVSSSSRSSGGCVFGDWEIRTFHFLLLIWMFLGSSGVSFATRGIGTKAEDSFVTCIRYAQIYFYVFTISHAIMKYLTTPAYITFTTSLRFHLLRPHHHKAPL